MGKSPPSQEKSSLTKNIPHKKIKWVVARIAIKFEFSELHNLFCSIVKTTSIGHIFERISIFYQVVLKISRLENNIFWIYAT